MLIFLGCQLVIESHGSVPLTLQVLLSQSHRFRALVLLGRFLDMGAWAVDLVNSSFDFLLPALLPAHSGCYFSC